MKTLPFRRLTGFNLIEAAIVLGIIGIVVGGIWVAAAAVQANLRKSDGARGLLQIVQNVRELYASQSPAVSADITPQLIRARAIPSDFINGTNALNPWNGAVTVGLRGGGAADTIDVSYAAMPQDVCVDLTARNTSLYDSVSLSRIIIDNGSATTTVTSFPFTPAQASAFCGATNLVIWSFGLQ